MDGIFDVIDDGLKLSIVDSTMMSIVHRAMNKAHGRVKSREGVIERLHEISKFYELSVMQLDGCIEFVQEETDSHNPDRSYEEVLAGLAEIRNRLQRRLYESELAILQKDRELADRFESESRLREALEITERELISSQEDLEIARSANLSPRDSEEGEFCELKDSMDRLEIDGYEAELMIRNHNCTNDIRVEEMGSDIDILKETLDMAFGKMQSAIFCSEMGPIEQQIKSSIENDVISISLKGFVSESQEDLMALNAKVNTSLGQNKDVNEEEISLEKGEQAFKDNNRQKSDEENMGMHNQITSDEMPRDRHECPQVCSGANLRSTTISYKTEAQNKDEITAVMQKESLFREEIYWFIFGETVKSITCKANQCLQTKIFDDFLRDFRITIREDVCSVFFREMVREWEEKIEACNMETSIREEICYTILNEAEREVSKFDVPRERLGECTNNGLELKCTLETIVNEPEKVCQISHLGENLPYRKLSLLNKLDSKCLKFLECPQFVYDFELMANKLGAMMLRLEEMKHSLDPIPQAMVSLQENKSLYKKAFITRCQNLRKAEYEVDLLGDQVDILLTLIEKIYLILHQHSPVLQQYFDVSEVLRLIKNGVTEIVCTSPEKS